MTLRLRRHPPPAKRARRQEQAMSLLDESLAICRELGMRPLTERALSRRVILKASSSYRPMITDVTTYYLEMTDPKDLRPSLCAYPAPSIEQAQIPSPDLNRFLYNAVGGDWHWTDRLPWTFQEWQEWVNRPELKTWVAYASGTPAGYFELETQPDGSVEIASFGLLPSFIGRGLGGHLLTIAVQNAWQMGAARVWLHTCTLDHPNALRNYSARGFRVFRESTVPQDVPADSPGP